MKDLHALKAQTALAVLQNIDPTSQEFKGLVANLLGRIDPHKPFGTELFNAIARVSVGMSFEAALFRVAVGKLEVYLRRRGLDETAYPGEWHVPGSFFRPGEKPRDVADRLEGEFGIRLEQFNWVGQTPFPEDERGSGMSQIYLVKSGQGELRLDDRHNWFNVNELPETTVHSHRNFVIPIATAAFRCHRG